MTKKEKQNINVLIIEDNPADVKLASIMLKEDLAQSFTVKSAGLFDEGMKLLGEEKFDVVLLDINLPDNYALAGLEKISAKHPGIPVILLTGLDDESIASNALQKNAADHLIKAELNANLLVRSIRYAMERDKKENELRKLNRTRHALSEISKAMILLKDESAFLKKVCEIIVNDCGYSMVWIAYSEEDEAKTIRPVAYAGFEEGYLKTLNLTWADTERGRGPTGTAIRTGKIRVCPDMLSNPAFKPWREEALKRGYASSIAMPMNIGSTYGALTIYSKETDPFSKDEVSLLAELAGYIAFGIMAIRSRTTQLEAEEALKASEKNYRDLIETAGSIIIRYTPDGIVRYINDFGLEFFGYTREEIVGKSVMKMVPDSDSVTGADLTRLAENILNDPEKFKYSENENVKKNGERAWVIWANKAVKDGRGELKEILCIGNDITRLKISESQLRYQAEILGAVSDAVIATDLSFNITSWNKRAELMYGWKAEEVLGKPVKDIVRSEMSDEQRAAIYKKVREGKAVPVEVAQHSKEGSRMISECYSMPIRDSSEVVKGYVTVNRNITARKIAEEALNEQRIRTSGILESIADTFFSLDDKWRFTVVNPAAEKAPFGRPAAELIGKSIWDLYPNLVGTPIHRRYLDAAEKQAQEHYTAQSPLNGRWYEVFMQGWKGGVDVYMRDVTESKKMEEKLVETRDYLENLFDYANAPIICWDPNFTITRFNHAFERLAGRAAGEVIGRHLDCLFPPDSYEESIEKIRATLTGEKWDIVEIPILRKDGDIRIVLWNSANVYGGDGRTLIATIAQGQDITERKKAEEILKRDKEMIEKLVVKRTQELLNVQVELERSKRLSDIGTLAATVAHELRNPLGVIRTAVYNIKRKNQNNNLDSHLANIEKKISESNQIINNLLDYSRIKVPNFEKIGVSHAIDECVEAEKEKYFNKKIEFVREFGSLKDVYVNADSLQIKEVFNNILDNACQAMDKDEGIIEVSGAVDGEKNVIITFKDNGSGIAKEDIQRLFEPFFTKKSKGTGLGLTICKELISLHNGKIDVESVPGQGTSVTITLPAAG